MTPGIAIVGGGIPVATGMALAFKMQKLNRWSPVSAAKQLTETIRLPCYEAATQAVEECRIGRGPVLLELLTYRRTGHSRRDPCHYQPKEERSAWLANDPILCFAQALLTFNDLDQTDLDNIREEIDHEIESAAEQAKLAPQPPVDELLTDVYA